MTKKVREDGPGSGDFEPPGRDGERGVSGPSGAVAPNAPGGRLDTTVAKNRAERLAGPQPTPTPLEPHEVLWGKRLDAGELLTEEMQDDGSMQTVRWPDVEWKAKSSKY